MPEGADSGATDAGDGSASGISKRTPVSLQIPNSSWKQEKLDARLATEVSELKRHEDSIQSDLAFIEGSTSQRSSSYVIGDLDANLKLMMATYNAVAHVYKVMGEKNPDEIEAHKVALKLITDPLTPIRHKVLTVLADYDAAVARSTSAFRGTTSSDGTVTSSFKPTETLLPPFVLSFSSTPVELEIFIGCFLQFYDAVGLAGQNNACCVGFLRKKLDKDVYSSLWEKIDENTPVRKPDPSLPGKDCIELLRDIFEAQYPEFKRVLDYLSAAQLPGESGVAFAKRLFALGRAANIHKITPEKLKSFKLVHGLTDLKLKESVTKLKVKTEESIMEELKLYDEAQQTVATGPLPSVNALTGDLNRLSQYQGQRRQDLRASTAAANNRDDKSKKEGGARLATACNKCGYMNHPGYGCPAAKSPCNLCKQVGHFKKMCPTRQRQPAVHAISAADQPPPPPMDATPPHGSVYAVNSLHPPAPSVFDYAQLNSISSMDSHLLNLDATAADGSFVPIKALADSGCTFTTISFALVTRLGLPLQTPKTPVLLFMADKTPLTTVGVVSLTVRYGPNTITTTAAVTETSSHQLYLSVKDLKCLGILHPDFPNVPLADIQTSTDVEREQRLASIEHPDALNALESGLSVLHEKYKSVFSDTIDAAPLAGGPMTIYLDDTVQLPPTRITTARQVPLAFKEASDRCIDELLASGVITTVEVPSKFVSPGFFVAKANGIDVRLVTDYTGLNQFVKRPIHTFPSADEILRAVPASSVFFVSYDAVQGYHQIALDEPSSYLTTFLVPAGRFRYLRACMGLSASSDEWCRRSDEAIQGIPNVLKLVDDILVHNHSVNSILNSVESLLIACVKSNLKLSRKKVKYGDNVKFAGFIVTRDGLKPDPARLVSLRQFPTPKNQTDVRSLIGLANQLGKFVPDLAHLLQPFRDLTKGRAMFQWSASHAAAFETLKQSLTSPPVIRFFDKTLQTLLLTDASRLHGLGAALMQQDPSGRRYLIECFSRCLNSAETNYATIELELLGILWGITKARFYLVGRKFTVVTDHKPLVGLQHKPLGDITNNRLRRIREKLADYVFNVVYEAGKTHNIADALSRAPFFSAPEFEFTACAITALDIAAHEKDPLLLRLATAASNDAIYCAIVERLRTSSKSARPKFHPQDPAKDFKSIWTQLSLLSLPSGVLMVLDARRIVIPASERPRVLQLLHAGHPGINKMQILARQLYFWPGITSDIANIARACHACVAILPRRQPELAVHTIATTPMDACGLDQASHDGTDYIIMVDRYSGYAWADKLSIATSAAIIRRLDYWFQHFGAPKVLLTDGAPNLTSSEFENYCQVRGIHHEISSVQNPASNGLSEAAVKNVKRLIKTSGAANLQASLESFRRLPRQDGISPAELFLRRVPRTHLPSLEQRAATSRPLHPFNTKKVHEAPTPKLQDFVLVQNYVTGKWSDGGQIVGIRDSGRSFDVKLATGATRAVNVRYLRRLTFQEYTTLFRPSAPVLRVRDDALKPSTLPAPAPFDGPAAHTRSKTH